MFYSKYTKHLARLVVVSHTNTLIIFDIYRVFEFVQLPASA